jgi:hypothetical protein
LGLLRFGLFCASVGALWGQVPDTGGPAILSRRGPLGASGTERGALAEVQPFLSLHGTWNSGYTPLSVDATGTAPSNDSFGASATAGVRGFHNWRRTLLGVHYVAHAYHNTRYSKFDGINQTLSLGVAHQVSRRVAVSFDETAGSFARSLGMITPGLYIDQFFAIVPTDEVFDSRVHFLSSSVDVTYQMSNRWSFNFGGSGGIVRRRSAALGGLNSYSGRADMQRVLTRNSAVGVAYFFSHYEFPTQFGASDIHAVSGTFTTRMGRYWKLSIHGGGARIESLFSRRVQLDPAIAAILGPATGVEAFYGIHYGFIGGVNLSRSFRRSSVGVHYSQRISPGNGFYLTSRHQNGGLSYSYTGFRKVGFGAFVTYSNYSSLTRSLNKYQSASGGVSVSYRLAGPVSLSGSVFANHREAGNASFKRDTYGASVGLTFSPGPIPVTFW